MLLPEIRELCARYPSHFRVNLQISGEKKTKIESIATAAGAAAAVDASSDVATTVTKNAETGDIGDNITVGKGRINDKILAKHLHPVGMATAYSI